MLPITIRPEPRCAKSGSVQDPTARIAPSERFGTQKLLARTLLQAGRPTEARRTLQPVLKAGADREASWLLSRAFLQEGNRLAAVSQLAASGTYRADHPIEAEPTPYVGEGRCALCHGDIFRAALASRHSRTFSRSQDLAALPLPPEPMTDKDDPRVSHSLRRVDGRIEVETRVEGRTLRAVVDYALGSSDRYLSMVGHDEQARLRVLRLSYHQGADGTSWLRTKDQAPHPDDFGLFLGKPFDHIDGANECLKCHTTAGRTARAKRP